jgi:hypothetical protein
MSGKSYLQNDKRKKKKVAFAEDELGQLEYCHNLVSQMKPEKEKTIDIWIIPSDANRKIHSRYNDES